MNSTAMAPVLPNILKSSPTLLTVLAVAGAVAFAISQGGASFQGLPVVLWCAIVAFAMQWAAFVPAFLRQTERFYDLLGSTTYLTVVATALLMVGRIDRRSLLLAVLISIWAVRLGSFLFRRVHRDGGDGRFDSIKPNAGSFLTAWTLQGLWVFLTLAAAIAAITSPQPVPLGTTAAIGFAVWLFGFGIEVIADRQKSAFRARPENKAAFIDRGLWAWSRHPNYFGEIVLWIGVAIVALPTLEGWRFVALVSPLFVTFLLTRISGVPLLEKRADKKWGGQEDYERYKRSTSILVPLPPKR